MHVNIQNKYDFLGAAFTLRLLSWDGPNGSRCRIRLAAGDLSSYGQCWGNTQAYIPAE